MVKQRGSPSEGGRGGAGSARTTAKAGARKAPPAAASRRRGESDPASSSGARRAPTGSGSKLGRQTPRDATPGTEVERRGGPRLAPTRTRRPEPAIPEGITGHELDRSVRAQLRTLSKENAEGVAQHLVMAATLLDTDPSAALACRRSAPKPR